MGSDVMQQSCQAIQRVIGLHCSAPPAILRCAAAIRRQFLPWTEIAPYSAFAARNRFPGSCSNDGMRFLILIFLVHLASTTASAQQPFEPVRKAVADWLQIQNQGLPGEVSVDISPLDAANQLRPCQAFDVSRPAGARAWGKTNVMVRCLDEANWRVYIAVHIRVKAPYLIAARPIAQGQVVVEDDLTSQTGDLSELPANILTDPERAVGQVAAANIPLGQPLRANQLKAQTVIRQGQTVRAVSRGPGFAVANEGRALNNAVVGQLVQVRLGNGQVVSGIAKATGIVEISY